MSNKIKKIDSIKNMAVFQDFRWNSFVRDKGNNVAEFKKINILYGRNYSGKTTLSRIFRALETGSVPDKYPSPEFQLILDDDSSITQKSLDEYGQIVRVFNEDFVKDNLRFIVDDKEAINSFAILGEDNTKLRKKIEENEAELGSEEEKTGLAGKLLDAEKNFDNAHEEHKSKSQELDDKLRHKANNPYTGIKHNREFGNANYDITKIEKDIATVIENSYAQPSEKQLEEYHGLLKEEESKRKIEESASFDLKYSTIVSKAKELVERKIQASETIQELLSDAALEEWVRKGREYHEHKRDKCAFCDNDLPTDLWGKLDKHFNQESEDLRTALGKAIESIESEKARVPGLLKISNSDFYSSFTQDLDELKEQFSMHSAVYCTNLESVKKQLEERKRVIFTPLSFNEPTISVEGDLNAVRNSYEKLRIESNQYTDSLSSKQSEAREVLRLHHVFKFSSEIEYLKKRKTIKILKEKMDATEISKTAAEKNVKNKREEITRLKAQLKDESKGAELVNNYLNNFFGHQFLSLKDFEEMSGDGSSVYRFEVTRDGEKAFHLSEGERNLIAFCYFMAKLEDTETKGSQPIIWIDDPVSSLDKNHIFFVYSMINAKIAAPEKYEDAGETKKRERFKQLFISTHNLDFLKYLKQLPRARSKDKSQYFLITRSTQSSQICLMPEHLKCYVTEFNFLFHQIYKCACAQTECDENHDCYYNFGNNARKFLEAFLYYKYPNVEEKKNDKLSRFFKDDTLAKSLTDRINNEFSHLIGGPERSFSPIDVPEMKTLAISILRKIKENDPTQYSALLQSIDVNEDPLGKALIPMKTNTDSNRM